MEISNHIPLAPMFISGSADAADAGERKAGQPLSMAAFLDALKLEPEDGSDQAQIRGILRDALGAMSPESRKELVSALKELGRNAAGTEVGALLDSKLPDVEKEAHKGAGIDRLLELLFMLLIMLGQANTARNGNAAKFGEITVKQAAAAGAKGVNAANSNLGGALAGVALGTMVAGVGFRQVSRATGGQIKNIAVNGRGVSQLRQQNAQTGNALNRQASPMTGAGPQEQVRTLDAPGRPVGLQDSRPQLGGDEHAVLSQPIQRTEAQINAREMAFQENQHKYGQQQTSGYIVSGFSQPIASVAQAGAGIEAAAQSSAGKVNDAEGAVASSVQHNEEQAAQRSVDLLLKIFALIASTTEQNRGTLDAMAQAIKA
jgi:hypothetical protein